MISGIGVDTVDISRFHEHLVRTPALRNRLFTPAERELSPASQAARFAAKEALIKALGGSTIEGSQFPEGRVHLGWQDIEVLRAAGRPSFTLTDALQHVLRVLGGARAHLSLTHDGGLATAFVIVERGVS